MFGGLHIEMVAQKMLGDWLQRNGWMNVLVLAQITSQAQQTPSCKQPTSPALGEFTRSLKQIDAPETKCSLFQYWATILELEVLVLVCVFSEAISIHNVSAALTELSSSCGACGPWLNNPENTRCSQEMHGRQLQCTEDDGGVLFISIKHAHIKGSGEAVGLIDNPVLCWMVALPHVARAITEFQARYEHWGRRVDTVLDGCSTTSC